MLAVRICNHKQQCMFVLQVASELQEALLEALAYRVYSFLHYEYIGGKWNGKKVSDCSESHVRVIIAQLALCARIRRCFLQFAHSSQLH